METTQKLICEWIKAFDGHYNISCVDETEKRANGNFKGINAKWQFTYCPYCGRKIQIIKADE